MADRFDQQGKHLVLKHVLISFHSIIVFSLCFLVSLIDRLSILLTVVLT